MPVGTIGERCRGSPMHGAAGSTTAGCQAQARSYLYSWPTLPLRRPQVGSKDPAATRFPGHVIYHLLCRIRQPAWIAGRSDHVIGIKGEWITRRPSRIPGRPPGSPTPRNAAGAALVLMYKGMDKQTRRSCHLGPVAASLGIREKVEKGTRRTTFVLGVWCVVG